ncbi:NLP/P60 protein [Segniliparus rotundus DSM] [Mycobacterium shimoidei]|uniref:NLP/P60 protein [Segniliparus rotundus DSM] n=1 Tax=Mycobacterium shimoidei TaxID=29313 RepID=A0A375YVR5_MYCSH|nr:NlpC/P60 family protein [Mycobacterium shimoidei]SRX92936.1 NLP/P60 protein [Segniliparus rotundus DSM] [Mycobacterium shimoidei]
MPLTIGDVEGSNFDALTRTAEQLGTDAGTMQQHQNTGRQAVSQLDAGWEGQASRAAIGNAGRTLAQQQQLTDAVGRVQSVLSEGGAQLSAARNGILQGVEQLGQQGWQVAPEGTVSVRPGSRLEQLSQISPVTAIEVQRLAAANSVEMKKQLANFESQDHQLAQRLREAIKDLPTDKFEGEDPNAPGGNNTDSPVPGPDQKPGDPGYRVPHAPGDPADYPSEPGWKSDAQPAINPPGYPPMPPGPQRDQNWKDYLSGKNADGTQRPYGQPPAAYPLPEAVQDKGLKIVGAAQNQQGTRYVWGGGSKDGTTQSGLHDGGGLADQRHDYEHRGFDCSGLTEYSIYQATGYDPDHFSGTQYQNMLASGNGTEVFTGTNLDTSNLQPGDIIYYDGSSGIPGGQHVAIYLGSGVTVETNTSGTPVHSQPVTTSMSGGNIRVVRPQ